MEGPLFTAKVIIAGFTLKVKRIFQISQEI